MDYFRLEDIESVVFIRLLGACESCAMSSLTLKQGIETHLQAQWPEISQVIQV